MTDFEHPDPTHEQMLRHLRHANLVAQRALRMGRHPFGALLLAPDHETVLAAQVNIDSVQHAESTLARNAALGYAPEWLWNCTLYTTFEPCAMCTGTAYWAHIGRIVYAVSETQLLALTGDHAANPTLDLPCRALLARGQKPVRVWGPFPELEAEMLDVHRDFWAQPVNSARGSHSKASGAW